MRFKYVKASILLLSVLLSVFIIIPTVVGADSDGSTPNFQVQFTVLNQKLYVSIPPSLYNYYSNSSHKVKGDGDYTRLVTPQTVEYIAESIQRITNTLPNSAEQFADAVLTLVHQIPYNITGPKYPVETLVDNSGDCTALSLLAASIMKAGGLDVVLIHYTGINPGHMNVGVYLPYTPAYHTLLMAPTSFEYDNKTYWTAEATPQTDWKVGDQSEALAIATPLIIPLDDTENSSVGQISARLAHTLLSSSITMNLSQQPSSAQNNTRALAIYGSISPAQPGKIVTAYINRNGSACNSLTTVTNSLGEYMLVWNFTSQGAYYITTSWSGTSEYAGADSETLAVFIGPESLIQFQTPSYNYIYGRVGVANYEVRPFLGINDFTSIPLGTNVTFSYDFTILPTGHGASNVQTQNVTLPAREETIRLGHRQTKTVQIPEKTLIVPTLVPFGLQPLRLPDDFNQTIYNQFSLILQSNPANNYSLNLKGLNDYDVTNIQDNGSNVAIVNATESIEENTWYRITAVISENGLTTSLQNLNGTLLESKTIPYDTMGNKKMVFLITNNVDSAVAFKDLKIEPLNNAAQPPESIKPTSGSGGSTLYLVIILLLALIVAATMVLYAKKKRTPPKTHLAS
jgi:hypothetical protein